MVGAVRVRGERANVAHSSPVAIDGETEDVNGKYLDYGRRSRG